MKVAAATGEDTAQAWRARSARSNWRRNPARQRRGPRGRYIKRPAAASGCVRAKTKRSEGRKSKRATKDEAWGVEECTEDPAASSGCVEAKTEKNKGKKRKRATKDEACSVEERAVVPEDPIEEAS